MFKVMIVFTTLPLMIFAAEWQALNAPSAGRADDMSIGLYEGQWIVYAADQAHKLYKSMNEGEYWDSIPTIPPNPYIVNPKCVITEPSNAQVVYIGKNDATPIWKSINGGQTWESKSDGIASNRPRCFAFDPYDHNIIYSGFESDISTFYKTTNAGNLWIAKDIKQNSDPSILDLTITTDPNRNTVIYAACFSAGIWSSGDGGDNWSQILSGVNVYSIEFANQVVGYAGGDNRIFKTTNSGVNWNEIILPDPVTGGVNDIVALSLTNVYITTNCKGIWETIDGGTNWFPMNNGLYTSPVYSLLIDPTNNQIIYAGSKHSVYKTINGGNQWFEITNGYRNENTYALSSINPLIITIGQPCTNEYDCAIMHKSSNQGQTWITSQGLEHELVTAPFFIDIQKNNPNYVYNGCNNSQFYELCGHGGLIGRSTDGGLTWSIVWEPDNNSWGSLGPAPLYCVITNPNNTYNNMVYAGYNYYFDLNSPPPYDVQYGFIYNQNYGYPDDWINEWDNALNDNSILSISIHPNDGSKLYTGAVKHGIFYSSDNGINWLHTDLNDVDVNALLIDIDHPDTMYAGSSDTNGVYRTNDGWLTWRPVKSGLDYKHIVDFAIDPSEPTLLYALCKENAAANQTYVYCTVDRGARWFDVTAGIPTELKTWDLEIDPTVADPVFAATDRGLYSYTPDFDKHMVSSSGYATANNNGRKVIRIMETDNLWSVYESGGVIYAVHSADRGQTWSKKMEIGQGFNPCIAAQPAMISQPPMGVIWRRGNLIQDTIYCAYYLGDNAWSSPYVIAVSSGSIFFDPPSMVVDEQGIAHVTYANNGSIYHAWFDVTTPGSVTTELIITGLSNQNPKNPCIGFLSSEVNPNLHVVWEDDAVIYYSFRTGDPAVWSYPEVVSNDGFLTLNSCHHPSLEISGDVVYMVWDGKDESTNQDIYWRNLSWIDGTEYWSWIWYVCNTEASSEYPVLASGFYCSWVEDGNEVYYAYYDPFMWVWTGQTNLSQSANLSGYPHLAYQQVWDATHIYFVWTENNCAPYHIEFRDVQFGGGGGGGAGFLGENGTNALGYYIVEAGKETKSPFNLKRTGIMDYGNEPYKKADYDNQHLEYKFSNLNPDKDYGIKIKFYQHGANNLPLTVKINGVSFGSVNIPQDSLITFQKQVPVLLYKNKAIDIKIYGNKALSGSMVLYEYERDKPKGGGSQNTNTMPLNNGKLQFNIFPIPTRNALTIEYFLPFKSSVRIGVYDVTGRLIAIPVSEVQNTGKHNQSLKIDELAQGVYFLRFEAGDQVLVRKVTILK